LALSEFFFLSFLFLLFVSFCFLICFVHLFPCFSSCSYLVIYVLS
jgi:hypothetical protein